MENLIQTNMNFSILALSKQNAKYMRYNVHLYDKCITTTMRTHTQGLMEPGGISSVMKMSPASGLRLCNPFRNT